MPATPATPATSRDQPLVLSASNAVAASGEAFGFGGVALGLGQLAVDWAAVSDAAAGASVTSTCAAGGTLTVALIDRDGNHRVSAGDQLAITLVNCYVKPLEDSFNGTLTIELATPTGAQQQAGTMSFGAQFDVVSGATTVRLGGGLRYDYTADRLTRNIHVASGAQALTVVGTSGSKAATESLTQLDATRSVRLAISGADSPLATVSALAGSGNGQAVVEVEVRNGAGDIDRAQVSFQVLSDMSQALVVAYRVGNAPLTIESSVAANGSVPYVRYIPANNVVDTLINSRLLASLPSGQAWQTGVEFNYGNGAAPGTVVVWNTPGVVCGTAPSGHLKVLDYALDAVGIVTRLAIDFENTCESNTTFGSIRFGSNLSLRP